MDPSTNDTQLQQKRGQPPQYAIVKLPRNSDAVEFYKLMLDRGYPEVSFVNEVRRDAFLPHEPPISVTATAPSFAAKREEPVAAERIQPVQQRPTPQLRRKNSPPTPLDDASLLERMDLTRKAAIAAAAAGNNLLSTATAATTTDQSTSSMIPRLRGSGQQYRASSNAAYGILGHLISPDVSNVAVGEFIEGEGTFSTCQLCMNRIVATRLSNLTNHVKRHAVIKQFACPNCSYSHNEQAKVRLHLQNTHRDFDNQPTDTLSYEMQRFGPNTSTPTSSTSYAPSTPSQRTYTCSECGEMVASPYILSHLAEAHHTECIPFGCSECAYQASTQRKVLKHISLKHPTSANAVARELPTGSNDPLFLKRFFPELHPEGEGMSVGVGEKRSMPPPENIPDKRRSVPPRSFSPPIAGGSSVHSNASQMATRSSGRLRSGGGEGATLKEEI